MSSIRIHSDKLTTVWDKEIEPDLRAFQIAIAREALAEEQLRGFDRNPRVIVDRRFDAPVESVKFGGRIEYAARFPIDDVVAEIFAELVARSPVLTGDYRDSHVVMVNNQSIAYQQGQALNLQDGDRVQIVNTQPYARKIEGGGRVRRNRRGTNTQRVERSGSALSAQAPNGVYRVVWSWAKQRFGSLAFVDFKWVKLDTNVRVRAKWAEGTKHGGPGGGYVAQNYPAILLFQTAAAAGGDRPSLFGSLSR